MKPEELAEVEIDALLVIIEHYFEAMDSLENSRGLTDDERHQIITIDAAGAKLGSAKLRIIAERIEADNDRKQRGRDE